MRRGQQVVDGCIVLIKSLERFLQSFVVCQRTCEPIGEEAAYHRDEHTDRQAQKKRWECLRAS